MRIQANGTRQIDDSRQVTFFTLTDDAGQSFKWHGNTPVLAGDELQNYLDGNIDGLYGGILRKLYPEAHFEKQDNETDLEAWKRWIEGGCLNTITDTQAIQDSKDQKDASSPDVHTVPVESVTTQVVEKARWKDTHPPFGKPIVWINDRTE